MFRTSTQTALVMVLLSVPASGQEWAAKMFSTTSHDFGVVARGAKAEYAFVLENPYVEEVHVAGVRASCSCTQPEVKTPTLKTHEKGVILAKFNTTAFLGPRGAALTVTFDKPYFAEVQLQVRGYIRGDVTLTPGIVDFGEVASTVSAKRRSWSTARPAKIGGSWRRGAQIPICRRRPPK